MTVSVYNYYKFNSLDTRLRPRHAMHVLNFDRLLGAVLSFGSGRFISQATGNPM